MSMITELVKRLKNLAEEYAFEDTDTMYVLNEAADVIEELSAKLQSANMERSSQYYNGGWVPVSERLPEEPGTYLVTLEYKEHGICITTLWYHGSFGWDLRVADVVTAWMPLPEPYKAESEGKE